jgi:hypothetical protein
MDPSGNASAAAVSRRSGVVSVIGAADMDRLWQNWVACLSITERRTRGSGGNYCPGRWASPGLGRAVDPQAVLHGAERL